MATEGVQGLYLETRNWGKSAKFFQALGFKLDFSTDHGSGQFTNGDGAYLYIAEIPADQEPRMEVLLTVADADTFRPGPEIEVVSDFADTHYGTREMIVRDPDGRTWSLQSPPKP